MLLQAAEQVGDTGRAVGIDLSSRMVELTAAEAVARGLCNITVAQGDAEWLDFPDGSFDAILGGLVIFMLRDPAGALASYSGLLTENGRLCFSTFGAQDENFDAAMKALGEFVPGGMPMRGDRQGAFATREGITELLTFHGFGDPQIDEVTYESRFADAGHWLTWVWSHGGRFTLARPV